MVAAINASRVSINTALTLIWHLKKIESNRTQTRLMRIQLTSSGDTLRQATALGLPTPLSDRSNSCLTGRWLVGPARADCAGGEWNSSQGLSCCSLLR